MRIMTHDDGTVTIQGISIRFPSQDAAQRWGPMFIREQDEQEFPFLRDADSWSGMIRHECGESVRSMPGPEWQGLGTA